MQSTSSVAKQANTFDDNLYALIVTDSPLTQKYVTAILRELIDLGNVQLMTSQDAAIKYIQNNSPQHCSFIFYEDGGSSDSHHAFIEAVRQEKGTSHTPIVVLGQQLPEDHDQENARLQLTTFLQRPFIPSALISLLFELFQEKDRRLAKRIDTDKLPTIVDMGYYATEPYQAQMLNISYTGCLVQTTHTFDDCGNLDDIGSVSFSTEGGTKIHLSGKIVRADEGEQHRIGFQFQSNEEEDLIKLGKFISALSK